MEEGQHIEVVDVVQKKELQNSKDPRDYYVVTAFQKRMAEIDPNINPWNASSSEHVWFVDKVSEIGVGLVFQSQSGVVESSLILLLKEQEKPAKSVHLSGLSERKRRIIKDAVWDITPYLKPDERVKFMNELIDNDTIQTSAPSNILSSQISYAAINLLPQTSKPDGKIDLPYLDKITDLKTKNNFVNYINLCLSRLEEFEHEKFLNTITHEIGNTYQPFNTNYPFLISYLRDYIFSKNSRYFDNSIRDRGEGVMKYTIYDKITRAVPNKESLLNILDNLPFERTPSSFRVLQSARVAEMVELNNIIGTSSSSSWRVSRAYGRGVDKIYELVNAFGKRNSALHESDPVEVVEIDDKYYVDSDGRHRVAALKALGVHEIPVLVAKGRM